MPSAPIDKMPGDLFCEYAAVNGKGWIYHFQHFLSQKHLSRISEKWFFVIVSSDRQPACQILNKASVIKSLSSQTWFKTKKCNLQQLFDPVCSCSLTSDFFDSVLVLNYQVTQRWQFLSFFIKKQTVAEHTVHVGCKTEVLVILLCCFGTLKTV